MKGWERDFSGRDSDPIFSVLDHWVVFFLTDSSLADVA